MSRVHVLYSLYHRSVLSHKSCLLRNNASQSGDDDREEGNYRAARRGSADHGRLTTPVYPISVRSASRCWRSRGQRLHADLVLASVIASLEARPMWSCVSELGALNKFRWWVVVKGDRSIYTYGVGQKYAP